MSGYSASEMMIVATARALTGVRTVFVGVGLPNIACNLARRMQSSDMELIYESGVYAARPKRLPLSIGDPTLIAGSKSVCSLSDMFGLYLQGGLVEVAILGGAQIDRHGNLNTTVIGDWESPRVRLPGSGGACEIATHAQRFFVIMRLKKRAFVDKLDFLTSPGHLDGGNARQDQRFPGGGPQLVITDLCVFGFEDDSNELVLNSLHPGVELDEVLAEVNWKLRINPDLPTTKAPTKLELTILRKELDPQGLYR